MRTKLNQKIYRLLSLAVACGWIACAATDPVMAQEIEIIGNDGKQVEIMPHIEGAVKGSQLPTVDDALKADRFNGSALKGQQMGSGGSSNRGQGLSVIGPDGQPMFLSTEDAQSVSIQRSYHNQIVNGNQTVIQSGKAIVVDADGQRHEYELAEPNNVDGLTTGTPQQAVTTPKSWMIGVVCQPVPEMLRRQLALDGGGLLVEKVQPGSPAEAAGLEQYDVLLFADDQELLGTTELVELVNEAGNLGNEIALTVVRRGQQIPIEVKPVQRDVVPELTDMFEMNDLGLGIIFGPDDKGFGDGMRQMRQMRQMMRGQIEQSMQRQFEQMKLQMDQMRRDSKKIDALLRRGLPLDVEFSR